MKDKKKTTKKKARSSRSSAPRATSKSKPKSKPRGKGKRKAATADGPKEKDGLPENHCYVVPVRNMVLFPGVVLPLMIGRPRSVEAIQKAVADSNQVVLLLQKEEAIENPQEEDLYRVGTL